MPNFEKVPIDDATRMTASGRRSRVIRENLKYIDQLEPGHAGRSRPDNGETVQALRRRLGKAANLTDKNVRIRRVGEEIYFWLEPDHRLDS